jgi:hypothetical protein
LSIFFEKWKPSPIVISLGATGTSMKDSVVVVVEVEEEERGLFLPRLAGATMPPTIVRESADAGTGSPNPNTTTTWST